MTFASFTPLLPVALFLTLIQGPATSPVPPAPPAPIPPPSTSASPAATVTPKDPASMVPLLDALIKVQDAKSNQQTFIDQANKQLQKFGADMQQDEVEVQAAIEKIKKENGWGAEVQFDRSTRKFEKVGAGAGSGSGSGTAAKSANPANPAKAAKTK